ncbi:MAG TPA: GAF domain-containing protein [Candidatus Cloacimonetes bacterium]|nr:GAF domain-containing protein [Candidatus Cloacimonadota bacterium]HEX37584.1 GAF domain-containing protein [Candidatus Cloacimonadota bacterium]
MDKNEISDYKEFNSVIEQLNQLIEKQSNHIKQLIHIGESLSAKNSLVNIFNLILSEAMHYCNADGGTIYVVSSDGQYLDFKLMFNVSLNQKMGDVDSPITWPSVPLFNIDESPNMNHMVSYVYHTKESKAFDDVYEQNLFDNTGTKKYDKRNNYRSKSMVAIPLINHEDEVMGVIQLINAQDEENKTIGFNEDHLLMLNSLASQAAISLSNSRLIENLEELLLQFIKSIATAIDRKSKYTAGHVKRVATLTEKMARAVNNDEDGAFENVYFSSDQLKEISMSGWMHDVGKIVIPECIMDKSTKLEKIIDRIELIRIRSDLLKEVIRKDILTFERDGILTLEKRNKLENIIAQIEKDYRLIEKLNIGSESLPDNLKNEIQRIQDFSYFSNGREYKIITDDEAKNLKIYRGTLTDEEFLVMKDHAQVTWDMLSPLQFPKKYENVPLYASSHHERLNGKGYPNKYPEQKIPLQARIIAVADVFEALLSDRPYKAGKKLSDALKIIAYMVKDHELDSRIVDLLLDSGLYLSFARDIVKVKKDLIDSFEIEEIKKIYRE